GRAAAAGARPRGGAGGDAPGGRGRREGGRPGGRPLRAAPRRPAPPYHAGPEAAVLGATAMIDVSDGLLADAGHLARASGVQIDISTGRFPGNPALAAAAAALGRPSALAWVLTGGEDHALAATFPAGRELPSYWTVIGQVREGQGVLVDGNAASGRAGWKHFGD